MKPESHFHRGHDRVAGGKMHLDIEKGGLHRSLGIPESKKIPATDMEKAEHSNNPREREQAVLAENMKNWKRK